MKTRRGYVILEALIAVVVMAISLTILMQALMNNSRVINTAQDYGKAWLLANEKLSYKTFLDSTSIPIENQAFQKPLDRFTYTLDIKPLVGQPWEGLKQADIVITWLDGQQRSVRLRTILPNDNSTQTKQSIFYN